MYLSETMTARVTVNGQTVTRSEKFKTNASAFIDECRRSKRTGDILPGQEPAIPWEKAVGIIDKRNEAAVRTKELSEASLRYYRNGIKPLNGKFGGFTLQEIEKKHVEQFKDERCQEVSASTVNMSLATLKRMFTVVCDELRARDYPRLHEAKIDVFKVKLLELDNANENFLETDDEIQALLAECRSLPLFKFCFSILNTGLRSAGALSLKKSDFDFKAGHIKKVVKGGTRVTIPLTGQYKKKVEVWFKELKVCPLDPWLIPSPRDAQKCMKSDTDIGFESARDRAAGKLRKAGKKEAAARMAQLTPHHLRHTFATHYLFKTSKAYGATVAGHMLSQILGHSSTYISERYSHILQQINQGAMQTYGDEVFSMIDFEPHLQEQGKCSCGAFLNMEGECKRCIVGIHVGIQSENPTNNQNNATAVNAVSCATVR
jgi:integrase